MKDFETSRFCAYDGPNYYLNRQALVFNLYLDPEGRSADHYRSEVLDVFPQLEDAYPDRIVDLFCKVLIEVQKMDIDLYVQHYDISRDDDEYVIAVEYLDEGIAEEAVHLVSEWFRSMSNNGRLDFRSEFSKLQGEFDKTAFGGPTLYSLIEAGLKRDIPVAYLPDENQFQWGYGRKQLRGRSTTFHVDGIKDTEFTTFKDMCKDFLLSCGFPTPQGRNCYGVEDAVEQAQDLGFPVVVKPVSGHKGQGVVTGIESEDGVRKAFDNIVDAAKDEGGSFDGAIVEQQVYGTDHRLLSVGGQFVAALQRVPAYVDGDGRGTIEELIERENDTIVRLDNARSPLCKIKIDDDLEDFLKLQDLSLRSVPREGERVFLRRVANISAGGVSINVTDSIHPANVKMVNDIAKFFKVTCLGIDVLAEDISKPWTDGDFGIIEINAGPGVFMHLAPAIGDSIDVPGRVMAHHFREPSRARIPIIAGNCLSTAFCASLYQRLRELRPEIELGALTEDGVHFNGEYFFNNPRHSRNVRIVLRNPDLDFAVFNHTKDDIYDYGIVHQGADVVVLNDPGTAEETLARDLLPDGCLVRVEDDTITVTRGDEEVASHPVGEDLDKALIGALESLLPELVGKYD
jgi:cyanophycin synthetase